MQDLFFVAVRGLFIAVLGLLIVAVDFLSLAVARGFQSMWALYFVACGLSR